MGTTAPKKRTVFLSLTLKRTTRDDHNRGGVTPVCP